MENLIRILFLTLLLSSCGVTWEYTGTTFEPYPHPTEVYWYNDYEIGGMPYFGFWNDFYYYYGVPHLYPWWYYYVHIPPFHYYEQWHVHVHCDEGSYVYGHRGPKFKNRKFESRNFHPTIKIKGKNDKSFVFPQDWKSSNSTRINKHNDVKYNINKQNYNRTFNGNFNQSFNKSNNTININKNNTINKGNYGSTRPNKTTTTRKPKR
jgi:hypothetical protein